MSNDVKDCSACGEEIKAVANKCKHCGELLGEKKRKEPKNAMKEKVSQIANHEKVQEAKDNAVNKVNEAKESITADFKDGGWKGAIKNKFAIGILAICLCVVFLFGLMLTGGPSFEETIRRSVIALRCYDCEVRSTRKAFENLNKEMAECLKELGSIEESMGDSEAELRMREYDVPGYSLGELREIYQKVNYSYKVYRKNKLPYRNAKKLNRFLKNLIRVKSQSN